MDRTILHCDCNGFYASVECVHNPRLKEVPMAVCGDPENRRGIILAKNELAKRQGVLTAETIWQAQQKCPHLLLVPPHHDEYHRYSMKINALYQQYTDRVEPFGIDESWLDVTGSQLALLLPVVAAGLVLAVAVIKPLNLLLLGENYARTMGLNVQRTRTLIFLSTVLLAGTVTAFCGPVGFIGLAVPHLARMLFASADHRVLMPASMLAGAALLLVCDLIAKLLALPINTITALMGIPVVIYVVVRNRNIF